MSVPNSRLPQRGSRSSHEETVLINIWIVSLCRRLWVFLLDDVGLHLCRKFVSKNIRTPAPVLFFAIVLEVKIVVAPVLFAFVVFVVVASEIAGRMRCAISLMPLAESALSILKTVLLVCRSLHVSLF